MLHSSLRWFPAGITARERFSNLISKVSENITLDILWGILELLIEVNYLDWWDCEHHPFCAYSFSYSFALHAQITVSPYREDEGDRKWLPPQCPPPPIPKDRAENWFADNLGHSRAIDRGELIRLERLRKLK